MRPVIGRHRAEQSKRHFAGVWAVAVLVGAALVSHAAWAQQQRRPMSEAEIMRVVNRSVDAAVALSTYQNQRIYCMDGTIAEQHSKPEPGVINPEVGLYCVALLRRSTQASRNPAEAQITIRPGETPNLDAVPRLELGLMAPYLAISADKGFAASVNNATGLLGAYATAAGENGRFANINSPTDIPLQNGKALVITQGVAFDVGYTETAWRAINNPGQVPQRPNVTPQQMAEAAEACFRNKSEVNANFCLVAGRNQAAADLNDSVRRSVR